MKQKIPLVSSQPAEIFKRSEILNKKKYKNIMEKIKKIIIPIIISLVLILGGTAFYFYYQFKKLEQDPQRMAQQEIKTIIAQVSQIMVLPEGEEPTIATVTNPERLRNQPFFAKAKVGDKVLLYTNSNKAILYDPVDNKIIEVAPISLGASQPATR